MSENSKTGNNLVIVESPAKAKTISQYLGSEYKVLSSYGHIRDLPKKGLNIDIEHNFEPSYAISPDKKKVVAELKKAAKQSTEIWLASDEDREGEAIAWHLCQALNIDPKTTKRIVFHEITKQAIEDAIKHPRVIDSGLVDAQQARRILDRLVGYELSPVLWKKIRPGLSAGRVQSVTVKLVVEREREIANYKPTSSYKITGIFKSDMHEITASLAKNIEDQSDAIKYIEKSAEAEFTVSAIEQKPSIRRPSAPFTTSSLQQEAARRLGFSVRQTMTIAQHLYENGKITYMRTDSTVLSSFALEAAKQYILKEFGKSYFNPKQFATKNQSAQEAHEAIRPTDFSVKELKNGDPGEQKLYSLIWGRALATQMADAKLERTEINISPSNSKEPLIAKGEILSFDGYLKVYGTTKDDVILPDLKMGQKLDLDTMTGQQVFTRAPARYSEASLVKKLEELGIGRPSTYAPTISTVQTRGYVEKKDLEGETRTVNYIKLANKKVTQTSAEEITGADRNKLVPTSVADVTTDFLQKYFKDIVDYDFTADVEKDFDKIAEGKEQWTKMIKDFYATFHPHVIKSEDVSRQEVSQARVLGLDPSTKKPIIARFGRYGPMLQRGETESEEKPDFAPLPSDSTLETVTLELALPMFRLPKSIGTTEDGKDITVNIGRFGPYIKIDKLFISLKDIDPFKATEEDARKLYKEKLKEIADKYIAEFASGVKIVNGPYGPYITDGKKNARIPKDVDPKKITEEEAKEMIKNAVPKKRFGKKKK